MHCGGSDGAGVALAPWPAIAATSAPVSVRL